MKKLFLLMTGAAMVLGAVSCNNGAQGDPEGFEMKGVDMGGGLLWAECNVGATTPEASGNYYAWGDTQPREDYSWASYVFSTELKDGIHFSKYTVASATLNSDDDVARKELKSPWRMPTYEEWNYLKDHCKWDWEKRDKVEGYKVTNEVTGASIFLPAAGFISEGKQVAAKNSFGKYWAADLRDDAPALARNLTFYNGQVATDSYPYRYLGFTVRAVRPASQ